MIAAHDAITVADRSTPSADSGVRLRADRLHSNDPVVVAGISRALDAIERLTGSAQSGWEMNVSADGGRRVTAWWGEDYDRSACVVVDCPHFDGALGKLLWCLDDYARDHVRAHDTAIACDAAPADRTSISPPNEVTGHARGGLINTFRKLIPRWRHG